jgi:hypothetical protein
MTKPPLDLAATLPLERIVEHFDIEIAVDGDLPMSWCPSCGSRQLLFYQDEENGGHWHHCGHCKAAGANIELVAKILDVPIREAISYILKNELVSPEVWNEDNIVAYLYWYIDGRQEINQFWAQSSENMKPGGAMACEAKRRLGLLSFNEMDWRLRAKDLIGATRLELIPCRRMSRPRTPLTQRRKDSDLVLIPFYRLPGLIEGFSVHSEELRKSLCSYLPATNHRGHVKAGGIAGLQTLSYRRDEVFVLLDPGLAIKLMVAQACRDEQHTIVASWPDTNVSSLLCWKVSCRPVVVWDNTPSVNLFRYAKTLGARVAWHRGSVDRVDSVSHHGARYWAPMASDSAVGWRVAFKEVTKGMSPVEVLEFARMAELSEEEIQSTRADIVFPVMRSAKRIESPKKYGWDREGRRWCLPDCLIEHDGTLREGNWPFMVGYKPTSKWLPHPRKLFAADLASFRRKPRSICWPVLLACLQYLLAPRYERKFQPIFCEGVGARLIIRISHCFGCRPAFTKEHSSQAISLEKEYILSKDTVRSAGLILTSFLWWHTQTYHKGLWGVPLRQAVELAIRDWVCQLPAEPLAENVFDALRDS